MKNLLFLVSVLLISCNNDKSLVLKTTPEPVISVDLDDKDIKYTTEKGEIINCGTLKDNLKEISVKCPTYVAANGKNVYFTSNYIYSDKNIPIPSDCKSRDNYPLSLTEENKSDLSFIYKIDQNKKFDVIKDANKEPLHPECNQFYSQIETNSKDDIFFVKYGDLYKYSNSSVSRFSNTSYDEIIKEDRICSKGKFPCPHHSGIYHFQINDNEIYYADEDYGVYTQYNNITRENNASQQIITKDFPYNSYYVVHNDEIFILDSRFSYNITIVKLNIKKLEDKPEIVSDLLDVIKLEFVNESINKSKLKLDFNSQFNNQFKFIRKPITDFKVNSKGELFFTDILRNVIWKVTPEDNKTVIPKVFAGCAKRGFKNGNALEAEFNYPNSITFDENDNMYVADTGNNAIRKITPDGVVSTFYSNED